MLGLLSYWRWYTAAAALSAEGGHLTAEAIGELMCVAAGASKV